MKRIAVEEHFYTQSFISYLRTKKDYPRREIFEDEKHRQMERLLRSADPINSVVLDPDETRRLFDLGEGRLREMDECGITMQVLSLCNPGVEGFETAIGSDMARKTNDELADAVGKHPDRFAGFAALA